MIENSLEDQWPFWKHIETNTPYRLLANGSPNGRLSHHSSGIARIILSMSVLRPHLDTYISYLDFNNFVH